MPNAGFQSIWLAGSRFYFQRDAITVSGSPVVQPILDFGTITAASPTMSPNPIILEDSDGGVTHDIAEGVSKIEETYSIKTNNLNLDILNFAFMADPTLSTGYNPGGVTGQTSQAATPVTVVPHVGTLGKLVKIVDAAGNPVFGITSIEAIHDATTTGTALVIYNPTTGLGDYQIVSLERGLIRLVSTGIVHTGTGPLFISYTPRAIAGLRTIFPHTQQCSTTGTGILIWGTCNNREQRARVARFSLTPGANTFDNTKWSDAELKLRVLYDPNLTLNPAGSLSYWLGDLPAAS